MAIKLSAPLFAQIELTEGCNHRCGYCSNPFSERRSKRQIVNETKRALDELLKNHVFSIVLTGGEPFTNRDSLNYALNRLSQESVEVYVNTNLSQNLGREDIQRLRGVNYVLVSFPSHNRERFNRIVGAESFNKVLNNLRTLSQENIPFGINQVVTPTNYDDVEDTVKFLQENVNLKEFSASPVIPTCKETDDLHCIQQSQVLDLASRLIEIEQKSGVKTDMLTFIPACYFPEGMMHHRLAAHGCSAGRDSVIIGANSEVRRCALLKESYGNIQNETLKTIWQKVLEVKKPKNKLCSDCMPEEYCFGGCEARAIAAGGEDPYIRGLPIERRKNLYQLPSDSAILTLGGLMHREEGNDRYLIGHGGSYVTGNEALLRFTQKLEGKKFIMAEVRQALGESGTKLVTYLFNRGILKECNSK